MKAPILKNNQHSVLSAELNTGIILTTDFKRHIGKGKVFHIFQTYELAIDFIDKKLEEISNLEFNIYDSRGLDLLSLDVFGKR